MLINHNSLTFWNKKNIHSKNASCSRHPSDEDPPHGTDDGSADAPRRQQNGEIPAEACRAHEQGGAGELSQIVADTARHAHARRRKQGQTAEQEHDREAQDRSRQAIGQRGGASEQKCRQEHADKGDGSGLPRCEAVQGKDRDQMGQSQLDPGDAQGKRKDGLQIAQQEGGSGKHARGGDAAECFPFWESAHGYPSSTVTVRA